MSHRGLTQLILRMALAAALIATPVAVSAHPAAADPCADVDVVFARGTGAIRAVAVFGNPGQRFGTPLSSTGLFAGRPIDQCSPGDPICVQSGRDRAAHSKYELPPYNERAASFVAGRL
jgi:hypothetical protein